MRNDFIIGRLINGNVTNGYEYVLSEESNFTFPMIFTTIKDAKDFMKEVTGESIEDIEKNYVFHDSTAFFIDNMLG